MADNLLSIINKINSNPALLVFLSLSLSQIFPGEPAFISPSLENLTKLAFIGLPCSYIIVWIWGTGIYKFNSSLTVGVLSDIGPSIGVMSLIVYTAIILNYLSLTPQPLTLKIPSSPQIYYYFPWKI